MGFGASKIDYKERNFTEQPLEKEEIDVLMKSIPKDDVLGSLNQEDKKMIINNYPVDDLIQRLEQPEREKIVKEIGNEKMFNLIGDRIFDYYFTNNKEDIKGCMKGHMNKDGTPCEDEKFKRMITTIPDLVQGPLGEKQIQWNTEKNTLNENYITLEDQKDSLQQNYDNLLSEKNTLKTDYDILESEKTNLETQWNTEKTNLETQWNTEKTNLESEKTNLESEITNLESEKTSLESEKTNLQTQWNTEKTNLQTQWNTEKNNLQTQWNTEKTTLQTKNDIFKTYFNTNFKKYISGAPNKNVSEQECKAYADYVGKPFSDAISSKTRDKWSNYIKGCQEDTTNVYWNPSISSTKRCGTGGYYCIQKPLTSEDLEEVSSGAPFLKFKEVRTGSPNKSVSKPECNEYALKIGYTWGGNSDDGNVPGCFVQKNYSTVYYNERDTSTNCQDINISTCIEKNDKHVNKEECKAYATDIRYTWGGNSNDGNVQGCFVQHDYNTVYYNEKDTSTNCQDISTSTCLKKK